MNRPENTLREYFLLSRTEKMYACFGKRAKEDKKVREKNLECISALPYLIYRHAGTDIFPRDRFGVTKQ